MEKYKYSKLADDVIKWREELTEQEDEYYIEAIETEKGIREEEAIDNEIQKLSISIRKTINIGVTIISIITIIILSKKAPFTKTLYFSIIYYLFYLFLKIRETRAINIEIFQRFLIDSSYNQEEFLEVQKDYAKGKITKKELEEKVAEINDTLKKVADTYQEETLSLKEEIKQITLKLRGQE